MHQLPREFLCYGCDTYTNTATTTTTTTTTTKSVRQRDPYTESPPPSRLVFFLSFSSAFTHVSFSHAHTQFPRSGYNTTTQENTYSIHRIRLHELRRNANHARRCDRRRDRTRDVLRNAVIQRLRLRRSSSSHTLSSFSSRPAPWPLCLCVSSRGSRGSIRDTSTGHSSSSCCLHRTTRRIAIWLLLCSI